MSDKDPRRVESGRRSAAKRWAQADPATRKNIRLDGLTPPQRAVVIARVEALRNANAREEAESTAA